MSEFPLRDRCEAKAKQQDIPHFTLLACDDLAVPLVRRWIKRAVMHQVNPEKVREARELVRRMEAWRKLHPEQCKIPD